MEIVNFLRDYWQYISVAILALIDFVVILVKRRPSSKDELINASKSVLTYLPRIINIFEEKDLSGAAKKEGVLQNCLTLIEARLGRELYASEVKKFYDVFSNEIETILSTPTKKGGYGREEDV